jgi:uncharacterized cupin superfamily protein
VNLLACAITDAEDTPGFRFRGVGIGPEVGGELIGCGVYELPPGEQLWPYHYHVTNEEWAVVVVGTPTLRAPDGERELRAGDVVGFGMGEAGAHTFTNASAELARVAIFSTLRPGGTVVYPDSDKVAAGPPGDRRCYRRSDAVDYWDGEISAGTGAP